MTGPHASPGCAAAAATPLLGVVVLAQGVLLLWVLRQPKELMFVPPLMLWHVPEAVGWGLVLIIVLLAPLRTKVLLCNPILVGIGVLSYSIYLWHVPVLHFGLRPVSAWWGASPQGWNGAGVVVFAILSVVVLAGSMLTYFAIERPFLRRKARLGV
ncbi:MAG: hypothetical protein KIT14_16835 [bacterium]|nr:hypothetical protein [bacterium]